NAGQHELNEIPAEPGEKVSDAGRLPTHSLQKNQVETAVQSPENDKIGQPADDRHQSQSKPDQQKQQAGAQEQRKVVQKQPPAPAQTLADIHFNTARQSRVGNDEIGRASCR